MSVRASFALRLPLCNGPLRLDSYAGVDVHNAVRFAKVAPFDVRTGSTAKFTGCRASTSSGKLVLLKPPYSRC